MNVYYDVDCHIIVDINQGYAEHGSFWNIQYKQAQHLGYGAIIHCWEHLLLTLTTMDLHIY